jgi:hypothetical protein
MATYHVKIDLDNASFWEDTDECQFDGTELARILHKLAHDAREAVDIADDEDNVIRDRNGNRVGRVWTDR